MAQIHWAIPMKGLMPASTDRFYIVGLTKRRRGKFSLPLITGSDNLQLKGKADDIRINIRQEWEKRYWSKKLRVSQSQLTKAVEAAGPMVRNVKNHLAKEKCR